MTRTVGNRVLYCSLMTDNRRWDALPLRKGDIVIAGPSRCGVTWTQRLVSLLVFDGPDLPGPLSTVSPWIDQTLRPIQDVVAGLEAQQHRRFIKTHTPLDGLVLDDRVTYIGVGRDPRDAAVSMMYLSDNMNRERMRALYQAAVPPELRPGPAVVGPGPDQARWGQWGLTEQFQHWMEGPAEPPPGMGFMPPKGMGSLANVFHILHTLWARRHLPNVALFHFADFEADLVGELQRLARVLGIGLTAQRATELAGYATFEVMRAHAADVAPNSTDGIWHSDERFFRSGRSGDWQRIFTESELKRYIHRINQLASLDLLAWAHEGRRGCAPDSA